MKSFLTVILFSIFLLGCKQPQEVNAPDDAKKADAFSRTFLQNVLSRNTDSSFAMVDPEKLTKEARIYIENGGSNLYGLNIKRIRLLSYQSTYGVGNSASKSKLSNFVYEYEFSNSVYVIFTTAVYEDGDSFLITTFNGSILREPIEKVNKLTFSGKKTGHYIMLALFILTILFKLTSFVVLILGRIPLKKKIIWSLLIFCLSVFQLSINWNTGEMRFKLLQFSFFETGFSNHYIYLPWFLSVYLPLGAILFWTKRKGMLTPLPNEDKPVNEGSLPNTENDPSKEAETDTSN